MGNETGTLVAINAEKVMIAEQDTALNTLLGQAEYLYADGISIVRAIRRKYPQAEVSRVAGADLWEGLMERAGKEGTPVFLVGGKPEILEQTESKLRSQWNVNIVGSQNGYFTAEERSALFERIRASGAKLSLLRWVLRNKKFLCEIAEVCTQMPYIWALGDL